MSNTDSRMNPDNEREQALFILAAAKPAAQRAAFLDRECGADSALRARLDALLAAHDQPAAMLDEPVARAKATLKLEFSDDRPDEVVGQKISHYKILEKIGEGGCGAVYMAQQQEPVRRRVALKIIKLGMDTKQVIARFEAERQALALMDHPNIAKVFDAGATETGRPYFVMELVKGIPITRYCDENNLNMEARLDLFVQVCQAVQHAHQKGIIHRDIKPTNVLVADHDGVPVPKIIDFGIAKATTDQQLTDKTLFTALEQFIGTPAYMSPEQARLSGLELDVRSDIYSLGVLLYELLTGKTPFEAKRLLEAGLDEIRRIIREEDPPRPSARLSTLDAVEQTTVARNRQSAAPRLIHLIRGDLDWIVMKCLEKDRARRYESANGLATEIQRYLRHEAIIARPPSNLYRFRKLVRRNRRTIIVGAGALGLFVGVVLAAISAWPAIKARLEARRARTAIERLVLLPAPWQDGEEMSLAVKIGGMDYGHDRQSARAGEINGQKIWRLTRNLEVSGAHTAVEAVADRFMPLRSRIESDTNLVESTYLSDHVEIKSSGVAEVRTVALDGPVFDNEEFVQLVRRLPLKSGYKINLPLFSLGSISIWNIEVSGVETVTVPAGTFECFKLKPFNDQTYWFSTDSHHYLVKASAGPLLEELSDVGNLTESTALLPAPWLDGEELQFDGKSAGIKLGTLRISIRSGETNGQKTWQLDDSTSAVHARVEALADSFVPIHSRYDIGATRVDLTYHSDHVEAKSSAAAEVRNVPLNGTVFDNEQFFQLVRRLPLKPGYKTTLPLLALSGPVINWQVEVSSVETLTVPAGTFECFKLKPFNGKTYWYSTDSHHYPVKLDYGSELQELSVVGQRAVLLPAPWLDGEEMQLERKMAGAPLGTWRLAIRSGETNGQKIWKIEDSFSSGQRTRVEAMADSFVPIHSRYDIGATRVDLTYHSDHVEAKSSTAAEVRNVPLNGPVFDNEQFFQLVRRLPLKPGYKTTLPLLALLSPVINWQVEVSSLETVTVPAGTFECFKLKPFHGQTYWYSSDPHHYLVRYEAGSAVGELTVVRH